MEIEMDKFLAKKHAVFKDKAKSKGAQGLAKDEAKNLLGFANLNESQMRYKINSCIL
jgi:type IV secretory pathway VirD2 relaxase